VKQEIIVNLKYQVLYSHLITVLDCSEILLPPLCNQFVMDVVAAFLANIDPTFEDEDKAHPFT
jgi:hypothetical protein